MATEHVNIADPNIHEPKGVAAAAAGKTYMSNGAGSGSWSYYTTATTSTRGIMYQAEADANITDSTAGTAGSTLAALSNPTDTPASADALRDDLVANVLPTLRNWAASLAAEINDLKAKLRTAGILNT